VQHSTKDMQHIWYTGCRWHGTIQIGRWENVAQWKWKRWTFVIV